MRKVNAVKNRDTKVVEVSHATHEELGDFGRKRESYGDIVARLLKTVKMYQEKYGPIELEQPVNA